MDILNPVRIGVDVGQKVDPTCICIVEAERVDRGLKRASGDTMQTVLQTQYTILSIFRLPLNTSYPVVGTRVADVACDARLRDRRRTVMLDSTGVGGPALDIIRAALRERPDSTGVAVKPIIFAYGENYDRDRGRLGKAYMVSRLQALLQQTLIRAPDTAEVRAMLDELKVYEIRVDQDGKDTYGAFKTGTHDDMVTALGLACLEDPFNSGGGVLIDSTEAKPDEDDALLLPTSQYDEWAMTVGRVDWW